MTLIGIDLGTTNSVVAFVDEAGVAHAIAGEDGSRIVPSAVWFPADGSDKVEVGDLAKRHRVIEPANVATLFKRDMGKDSFPSTGEPFIAQGKTWRPEQLSSLVVKKLVQIAEQHLGESIKDVVITVPAYFGEAERAATRQAGEIIGLNVHLLPAEPMAAAVAHGLENETQASTIIVFDLGGGTFDVTVLRKSANGQLEAIAHNGDRALGGADFDQLIVNQIAAAAMTEFKVDLFANPNDLAEAYAEAEKMKKDLSARESVETMLIAGGNRLRFSLTRSEFEALLAEYVETTELAVETALDVAVETVPGLTKSDIDTILMVGGSSRIPIFRKMLSDYFGKEPITSKNLDEDVARGAALMGEIIVKPVRADGTQSALAKLPAPIDRNSHAVGVTAYNSEDVQQNNVVLPANARIPTEEPYKSRFFTRYDGQQEVELPVNEGDELDLKFVDVIGEVVAKFDSPKSANYPLDVVISLDGDGILSVSAFDGNTGARIGEARIQRKGSLDPEQSRLAAQAVDNLIVV